MEEIREQLLGRWRSDPSDAIGGQQFGEVSLEFTDAGELLYTIHEMGKEMVIHMHFRLEGDEIVTNQTSSPQEERTTFRFDHGKLWLNFQGAEARYVRTR